MGTFGLFKRPRKWTDDYEEGKAESRRQGLATGILKTLPEAFNFDFEESTRNLIEDQGLQWVKDHEGLLRLEAECIAAL